MRPSELSIVVGCQQTGSPASYLEFKQSSGLPLHLPQPPGTEPMPSARQSWAPSGYWKEHRHSHGLQELLVEGELLWTDPCTAAAPCDNRGLCRLFQQCRGPEFNPWSGNLIPHAATKDLACWNEAWSSRVLQLRPSPAKWINIFQKKTVGKSIAGKVQALRESQFQERWVVQAEKGSLSPLWIRRQRPRRAEWLA